MITSSSKHTTEGSFPSGSSVFPSPGDTEDPFPVLIPLGMFLVSAGKYVYLNVVPAPSGCLTYETWCEEGNFRQGGGGGEGAPFGE